MFFSSHHKPRAFAISFEDVPSLTEQSHKDSCDMKVILRRGRQTGIYPVPPAPPQFGNGILPDFHAAQTLIASANQSFAALPSRLRETFDNDPSKFMDFVFDESNRDSLSEMGISTAHLPPLASPAATASTPATPVAGTEPKPAGNAS